MREDHERDEPARAPTDPAPTTDGTPAAFPPLRSPPAYARADVRDGAGLRPVHSTLTDREWEVLDLLCSGRSIAQVADHFVLSDETVRTHTKRVMRKLDLHTRTAAVGWTWRLRRDLLRAATDAADVDHPGPV